MRTPFEELSDLVLSLWGDPTFWRLLIAITLIALVLLLIAEVDWPTVVGFVALGCLAAMLEVTLRNKS